MRYRADLDAVQERKSSFPRIGPLSSLRPNHHTDQGKPAVHKYTLTQWSRTHLQKLIAPELVKKFPSQKPATCPFPNPGEYSPRLPPLQSYSLKIHFTLAFHLRLVLLSSLLPSALSATTLHQSILSPLRATCHTYLIFLFRPLE